MPHSTRPGDVLAGRYRLVDLLDESGGARFWRAHDHVLQRHVALHVIAADDERAAALLAAARRSAMVLDPRLLRVLDAEQDETMCYVVNEWGDGVSLDVLVATQGPLEPRRAAWLVGEVADAVATAHAAGVAHGRLIPENVLVDRHGEVKLIGLSVDAAMHGHAGDRTASDVTDLAGLLYCGLTARWPGSGGSAVPAAPVHHGHALRPRRVRAGVPGQLDALCAEVLRAQHHTQRAVGLGSARGIADLLGDYVGDPDGISEAWRSALPGLVPPARMPVLPDVPDPLPHDATPADGTPQPPADDVPTLVGTPTAETEATEATEPTEPPTAQPASVELPTEAGLPIFGEDDDDVSWLAKRTTPAPPPPPFEKHPERPLFAPEPAAGEPARRSRPGAAERDPASGSFWPFDTAHPRSQNDPGDPGGPGGPDGPDGPDGPGGGDTEQRGRRGGGVGSLTTTGSGILPSQPGSTGQPAPPVDDAAVPGRSWLRLAALIAAGLLLLVTVVVAYNLGRGRTPLGADPRDSDPSTTPSATPAAPVTAQVTDLTATDLDPQGTDGEENSDQAPLAVDGDPATTWSTQTYEQQLGPGGLKNGVGLLVDLGATRDVTAVDLSLVDSPTAVELYLTDDVPGDPDELEPVAEGSADGDQLTLDLPEPVSGRYLTVWLVSLPEPGPGEFRGTVAEVVVQAVEDDA